MSSVLVRNACTPPRARVFVTHLAAERTSALQQEPHQAPSHVIYTSRPRPRFYWHDGASMTKKAMTSAAHERKHVHDSANPPPGEGHRQLKPRKSMFSLQAATAHNSRTHLATEALHCLGHLQADRPCADHAHPRWQLFQVPEVGVRKVRRVLQARNWGDCRGSSRGHHGLRVSL